MRNFWRLCYVSKHEMDKFAPRADPCVFLGYPFGQKGYKLLNLATHTILVSRHVVFHETFFPYLHKHYSNSTKFITSLAVHSGNSYINVLHVSY